MSYNELFAYAKNVSRNNKNSMKENNSRVMKEEFYSQDVRFVSKSRFLEPWQRWQVIINDVIIVISKVESSKSLLYFSKVGK